MLAQRGDVGQPAAHLFRNYFLTNYIETAVWRGMFSLLNNKAVQKAWLVPAFSHPNPAPPPMSSGLPLLSSTLAGV